MCMKTLNSFDEFNALYENLKGLLDVKKGKVDTSNKMNISICVVLVSVKKDQL